ncbi:hypothetical protein [Deinococcus sp. RM]|uniref:hypothetical protein n=1 Tax=Deinococcus sp. RM TaxID=2316359 RepID=UPI000E6A0123|nr:hypothetical protein [Deinococcus sp. RM]RIX96736.1 hypothetical protein D3W47_19725 [Deinococcus sp. RM]
MSTPPPDRPDDPHPHAAYLAVTADGEVIGVARGHPGSTLILHFFEAQSQAPAPFTLRPHNVPDGRRAPALVCHAAPGVPVLARQKRGGHYVVSGGAALPVRMCLHAVYDAWIWRRLQAMADQAAQRATPAVAPRDAQQRRDDPPPMPLLPFPLATFTPHRRRPR